MYGHFPGGNFRSVFSHAVAERLEESGRGLWLRVPYLVSFRQGLDPGSIIFGAVTKDWTLRGYTMSWESSEGPPHFDRSL